MLNIGNMVEEDKLHYFMSGFKVWAQRELRRQNVQTLNSVIVAANKLADFDEGDDPKDTLYSKSKDKEKEWKKNEKGRAVGNEDEVGQEESSFPKQKGGSFVYACGGPHLKRDCLVQAKVNALITAELDKEKDKKADSSNINALALVETKIEGTG